MTLKKMSAIFMMATTLIFGADAFAQQGAETWKPIGNGILRDDMITASYSLSTFFEFPVEMQESEQTPGRYRLVNAYKNCPSVGGEALPDDPTNYLVVDASDPDHVYIEAGAAHYNIGEGQFMAIGSIAHHYYDEDSNFRRADEEGVCGKLSEGAITFPPGSVLMTPIEELEYDEVKYYYGNALWYQANRNNKFRLLLPGTPYTDVKLELLGLNDANTGVNYSFDLPDDVEYVKAGIFEGEYTADMRARVESDEVQTYRIDYSQVYTFPMAKNAVYTVVAVPYAREKSWPDTHLTREWAYSEDEWKKVGTGHYVDAIFSSNELNAFGFMINEYDFDVQVEQSVSQPWMIRLVDPYGPDNYPYATALNYDMDKHHYMTFDMGRFDCVHLLMTDPGIDLNNGRMDIRSQSDLYIKDRPYGDNVTIDEFMANDEWGKIKYDADKRELNFDKNSIRLRFTQKVPNPMTWYMANQNGHAHLTLPKDIQVTPDTAVEAIDADDENAETEYFTIDGMRVNGAKVTPGVYIIRKGSKVSKVLIK